MSQVTLFDGIEYDDIDGIDLRNEGVEGILGDVLLSKQARLIIADPPWPMYKQKPGKAHPTNAMPTPLSLDDIIAIIDRSYDLAAPGARLKLWMTWPLLQEWFDRLPHRTWRWRALKTGGAVHREVVGELHSARSVLAQALMGEGVDFDAAWNVACRIVKPEEAQGGVWHKTGGVGPGYHHRGTSEPYLIYVKPGATPVRQKHEATGKHRILKNSFVDKKGKHSEKPVGHLIEELLYWTEPDDLVIELFAGKAPGARAAHVTGRRYVGFEPDRERWQEAMDKLRALDIPAWARILAEDE